jgi:hypothetical protein
MGWALTAIVLTTVSLLVVALTMEQGSHTMGHRTSLTVSRGPSLLLLRRLLLAARAVALATGHRVGSASRIAWREGSVRAVALGRGVRTSLRAGVRPETRIAIPGVGRRTARTRQLRFEDCLQMTGPGPGGGSAAAPSILSQGFASASRGWLSRLVAALELVATIAVAGGAIALALIAAGWKASGLF